MAHLVAYILTATTFIINTGCVLLHVISAVLLQFILSSLVWAVYNMVKSNRAQNPTVNKPALSMKMVCCMSILPVCLCILWETAYLSLDAPSASTMGSAISSMDCKMEATTMKRMILRRKARWMTWSSIRPVWTARINSVIPSVIPLTEKERKKIERNHRLIKSTKSRII